MVTYHACLVLVNISLHTKFEVPSFTHFKCDWAPELEMDHVALTTPIWGLFVTQG